MQTEQKTVPQPNNRSSKNEKKKKLSRLIWLCLLAGTLFFLLAAGLTFFEVKGKLESGQQHLRATLDLAGKLQETGSEAGPVLDRVELELAGARVDFKKAREGLGPFSLLLQGVGWLPGPFYDTGRLPALLDLAVSGADTGLELVAVAKPAWQVYSANGASATSLEKIGKVAEILQQEDSAGHFLRASDHLAGLKQARGEIQSDKISLSQVKKLLDELDKALPQLEDGLAAARIAPRLLPQILGSAASPKKYLVLAQNSDELRPTGGFISAVGLSQLNGSRASVLDFKDSYQIGNKPYVAAPPALAKYMLAGSLTLRDANWWADFPTSAREIAGFYRRDTGIAPDGVIALDMQAVAYLFDALGPLSLPKYGETLTAQNFQERIRFYYLQPGQDTSGDWWLKRKDFIGDLFRGLMAKLESGGGISTSIKLAGSLGRAFNEKHLLLYSADTTLEAELAVRGLDGGLGTGWRGDFLAVVDANTGFSKISPKIQEEIGYRVEAPQAGWRKATLTIRYTNTAARREGDPPEGCKLEARYGTSYESMMAGCYWDYLRVYTPAGSKLESATGFSSGEAEQLNEAGRTVFAGQLVLEPGKSATVSLIYLLPPEVNVDGVYRLLVQKQPGTGAIPLSLDLEGSIRQEKLVTDWQSASQEGH